MNIALIGPQGSGKSTLVFSLSSFFRKKGFKTGCANFDLNAKKLKFNAFFDARKMEKSQDKLLLNFWMVKKKFNDDCKDFDFVFIDLGASLDTLITTNFSDIADVFLFISTEFNGPAELNTIKKIISSIIGGKPVIVIKSKSDLKKKTTLITAGNYGKNEFLEVCGVDRMGFEEIYKAVENLREH